MNSFYLPCRPPTSRKMLICLSPYCEIITPVHHIRCCKGCPSDLLDEEARDQKWLWLGELCLIGGGRTFHNGVHFGGWRAITLAMIGCRELSWALGSELEEDRHRIDFLSAIMRGNCWFYVHHLYILYAYIILDSLEFCICSVWVLYLCGGFASIAEASV